MSAQSQAPTSDRMTNLGLGLLLGAPTVLGALDVVSGLDTLLLHQRVEAASGNPFTAHSYTLAESNWMGLGVIDTRALALPPRHRWKDGFRKFGKGDRDAELCILAS